MIYKNVGSTKTKRGRKGQMTMLIEFHVTSHQGEFTFVAKIHQFGNLDDFHLDPNAFYQQWGKAIPKVPHHEIEITTPGPDFFKQVLLHVHKSRKDPSMLFVCYPRRIATADEAASIFRTWCLGSVTTIVQKVDLNTIFTECGNDSALMEHTIKERFGIEIMNT
jgi:hypothetical protein